MQQTWSDQDRTARLLTALVRHNLHCIPAPSFAYDMRVGMYGYSIRLAWQHRDRRTNLFIRLTHTMAVRWDLAVDKLFVLSHGNVFDAPSLREAEEKVGIRILDVAYK